MIDDVETVGCQLLGFELRTRFCFLNGYIVFIRQPAKGFYITVFFMLHQKTDGVSAFATAKTFENFFGGRHRKRRCLFIVKRTVAQIIGTPFFEFDKAPHDIDDIDSALNLLYGFLANQGCKCTFFYGIVVGFLTVKAQNQPVFLEKKA